MNEAIWIKCTGEAHLPEVAGCIDNCGICAPFWEHYPICPIDGARLTDKGYCKLCRNHFNINNK